MAELSGVSNTLMVHQSVHALYMVSCWGTNKQHVVMSAHHGAGNSAVRVSTKAGPQGGGRTDGGNGAAPRGVQSHRDRRKQANAEDGKEKDISGCGGKSRNVQGVYHGQSPGQPEARHEAQRPGADRARAFVQLGAAVSRNPAITAAVKPNTISWPCQAATSSQMWGGSRPRT